MKNQAIFKSTWKTLNRMMAKNFFILFDVPMQIIFYSHIFTLIKIK